MSPDEQPVGADDTVRRWRPETAELDMLFVLHGIEGAAAGWAARAEEDDPVAVAGTCRRSTRRRARTGSCSSPTTPGCRPWRRSSSRSRVVLRSVVAEVDGEDDQQPLPCVEGVEVRWCYRHGAPAATTTLLVDAVRSMSWPAGNAYVWGGAESRCITAVRRHVRTERGSPPEAVSMTGYWRHALHADDA